MNAIFLPSILGVFALADWYAVARRRQRLEWLCKPAVMAVLIAIALRLHPDSAAERRWFVAALVLSLAGDVALMLDKFEVGLGSFLLAHLAYIAGFLALGAALPRFLGAALVLAFVGWAVGGTVLRAVGRSPLRVPVGLYMAAISVMAACALGTGRWLAALGALLFYVSDAAIAWNRFVRPFPSAKVLIIVTYHVAQVLLVASLVW